MAVYTGTSGNDTRTGTTAADIFNLQQGGDDTATGLGGNDLFNMGGAFDAAEQIDGGNGTDTLTVLDGDYSAGLAFDAKTLLNVERYCLLPPATATSSQRMTRRSLRERPSPSTAPR